MTTAVFPQPRRWVLLVALLALLGSCDAKLQPFAENSGLFSIHGYLTLSDEPHHIRVRNLNDLVLDDSTQPLEATVTLKNLESGETETLVDSVVTFDGVLTHNFRSEMDIEPEVTYEVSVERSDGRTSRATATMPGITEVDLTPDTSVACDSLLDVEFPEIDEKRFIRASVGLKYGNVVDWHDIEFKELDTGGLRHRFKPAALVDDVVPENVPAIVDCDAARYCNLLDDNNIRVAYTHFGPDWPADSTLADPLRTDVSNGTGVFAGLRRDTLIATTNATLRCPGREPVPCQPVALPCGSDGNCFCPNV